MDAESIFWLLVLLAWLLMFSLLSHPLSDSEPSVCPKAVHSPRSKSNKRKQYITSIDQTKLVRHNLTGIFKWTRKNVNPDSYPLNFLKHNFWAAPPFQAVRGSSDLIRSGFEWYGTVPPWIGLGKCKSRHRLRIISLKGTKHITFAGWWGLPEGFRWRHARHFKKSGISDLSMKRLKNFALV